MHRTPATKSDLRILRQELHRDSQLARSEPRQELQLVRKDMELLATALTVRPGSMLAVGLGLLFAGLKFG